MKFGKFVLLICSVSFAVAFIYGNIGYFTDIYTFSYSGFAVDSQGVLYIGVDNGKIRKYEDGNLIDTISAYTSRGYKFTIIENDKIYIHCGDRAYFTDLDGNVIEKIEGNIPAISKFRKDNKVFVSKDGTKYQQKFNLGRTKIIKCEDEKMVTVFEMPLENYFFKIILIAGWSFFFVFITIMIIKDKTTQDKTNHTNQGIPIRGRFCVLFSKH